MKPVNFTSKCVLTTAIVSCMALITPQANAQTLSDVVQKAITSHPEIETSRASRDIAEQDIKEQRSSYFPEISATATAGRVFGDNATSRGLSVTRGSGYSYLWEGSLTARQMVFDAFETKNRIDAARASEQAAIMQLASVQEDLALRAVQTYISLLRAREGYQMVQGYKANIQDYMKRIEALVDQGAADEAELQQARDVNIILKNFEADYSGQMKAAESDYMELTGELPEGKLAAASVPLNMLPEDINVAIATVKSQHPMIRGAQMTSKASEYGIEAEKAAYYPDVNGELSLLKSDKDDIIGGEIEDAKAVLRMNWGFETGGAQKARVMKKRLEHKTDIERVKLAERQIERMVRLAYAEKETAAAQYQNQKSRLDLNQKLYDTYETQFEGALVSLLQVMQADNQLFNAKLETANARYRNMMAQYSVLASVGSLQSALDLQASELEKAGL